MATTINGLSNFKRNRLGGVDAIKDGEPYTLTKEEESLITGNVEPFDAPSYNREAKRLQLKAKREANLQLMEHTFADGRVVQVRPQDEAIFKTSIKGGQDSDWIMKDNTVDVLTVAEMQEALASGVTQGKAIFAEYMNELKQL